ncbi:tyrosine-type recombinase/integrase [Streptomyces sp. NPDC015131]|uniref:tyrosine-type recombinase/integrase n=1 Tax=Streptomyces sp. NPDC015131 TaxID=3364941 RepID=UPI0036FC174B
MATAKSTRRRPQLQDHHPSVHEAVLEFVRAQKSHGVPHGTVKQYRQVNNRLVSYFQGRQIAGITADDLAQFLYGEGGILVGRDPKTGTTYRSAINALFRYAKFRKWIRREVRCPTPVFKDRTPQRQIAPTRLTEDELISLIERAEHPVLRAMVAVAVSTALRISDIVKLKIRDVDFETGDIYVWIQKTGRFHPLPLTLDLEEELRRYLLWYTRETGMTPAAMTYLFPGWSRRNATGTGYVYYVPDPSTQAKYSWCTERLKGLFLDLGIILESGEAWHTIRRSVARIYFERLRAEVSHDHALRETMVFLGHKSQETTEKYLGIQAEIEARNARLRGQRFIGRSSSVTDIRQAR